MVPRDKNFTASLIRFLADRADEAGLDGWCVRPPLTQPHHSSLDFVSPACAAPFDRCGKLKTDFSEKRKLNTCDFDVHSIKMANKKQYEYCSENFFYFPKLPTRLPTKSTEVVRQTMNSNDKNALGAVFEAESASDLGFGGLRWGAIYRPLEGWLEL